MKASKLVAKLQAGIQRRGDLPVHIFFGPDDGDVDCESVWYAELDANGVGFAGFLLHAEEDSPWPTNERPWEFRTEEIK